MKNCIKFLLGLTLAIAGFQVQAVPCLDETSGVFTLGTTSSGTNSAANSVSISCEDHTGNDSWDSGLLEFDGMIFDALQKTDWETSGLVTETNVDINLTVSPVNAAPSGTWSFTNVDAYDTYIIVLKDGVLLNDIKWSAYLLDSSLFDPATSSTWAGDWIFGGGKDLSHLSVYGKLSTVSEPGILALLGMGLVALGIRRRLS